MLEPDTMRPCNNAVLAVILTFSTFTLGAQEAPKPATPSASSQAPSLTVDRDPVRSPDPEKPASATGEPLRKEGEGYVLHTNVEEVVLNATVLQGTQLVQTLKRENFQVYEDGAKQGIIS